LCNNRQIYRYWIALYG